MQKDSALLGFKLIMIYSFRKIHLDRRYHARIFDRDAFSYLIYFLLRQYGAIRQAAFRRPEDL